MSNQAAGGVRKKKLLLLDTGDNCRCPMAEGYLKKLLHERGIDWIQVSTAGVMTPTGLLPTPEAEQLLKEEGVDISRHRSRPMKAHMLEDADLVLGMSSLHVQKAIRETEAAKGKTFLLKEYVGYRGKDVQIPDPMGGTMDTFKRVFEQLKDALEKLVETDFIKTPPPGWLSQLPSPPAEEEVEEAPAASAEIGEDDTGVEKVPQPTPEATAVNSDAVPKEKRKPGRPRKVQEEKEEAAAPPRKRGRPKKQAVSEEAQPATTATTKRKRGRPRKAEVDKEKPAKKTKVSASAKKAVKPASKTRAKAADKAAARGRKAKASAEAKTKTAGRKKAAVAASTKVKTRAKKQPSKASAKRGKQTASRKRKA